MLQTLVSEQTLIVNTSTHTKKEGGNKLWLCIMSFCSLIGTIMIAVGFYTVLWGQAKEKEEAKFSACKVESSTQDIVTPLLKDTNAYEA